MAKGKALFDTDVSFLLEDRSLLKFRYGLFCLSFWLLLLRCVLDDPSATAILISSVSVFTKSSNISRDVLGQTRQFC